MATPAERAQRWIYLVGLGGVALMAGLAVISRHAMDGPIDAAPRTVTARPVSMSMAGVVTGRRSVALRPLYQGEIRSILVSPGRDRIAAGTPLFVLSRRAARIEFIERQRRLAAAMHDRIEDCAAAGTLSKTVDRLYRQYFRGRAAARDIRLSQLHHDVADRECAGAIAGELWARTTLSEARDALAGTVVHAPFDLVVLGVTVAPGTTVTPTTELARVMDVSDLIVLASGVVATADRVAIGAAVRMRLADGRVLSGRVAHVEVGGDEAYPDDVLVEVDPEPAGHQALRVGEAVDVLFD
jgi:multidrug efflux pump subunit AcrA (membrane-fusion protein)